MLGRVSKPALLVFQQRGTGLPLPQPLLNEITRYPGYLPGGISSEAFDDNDSERALYLSGVVVDFVKEWMG